MKGKVIDLYGDGIGQVELVDFMGSDLTVVNAARVSFNVEKEELEPRDVNLINYLQKHRHTSPFEHVVATFKFTVPLFVRSQHMRHRTWAYNEISRRYTSEDLQFYLPTKFRTQHKSNRQASNLDEFINPKKGVDQHDQARNESWVQYFPASDILKDHTKRSLDLFNWMVDNGIVREQARMVLPQNLYAKYFGTVDLHNLLHFVELRRHEGAQWEIQRVAEAVLELASDLWPVSVKAFQDRTDK